MPFLTHATSSCNFFYRNEFLQSDNIRFESQLKRWEDIPFYISALIKASRVSIYPEFTRIRRRHQGSLMSRLYGYDNYQNRGEEDVAMCLHGIDMVETYFRGQLETRPGLAAANKEAQKLMLSKFGRLALGNLIGTDWARTEVAAEYRWRMRAIARNMDLKKSDFAIDHYQRVQNFQAVDRNFRYYKYIRNGKFEKAYAIQYPASRR